MYQKKEAGSERVALMNYLQVKKGITRKRGRKKKRRRKCIGADSTKFPDQGDPDL